MGGGGSYVRAYSNPPPAPEQLDPDILAARRRARSKASGIAGREGRILTGPSGLEEDAATVLGGGTMLGTPTGQDGAISAATKRKPGMPGIPGRRAPATGSTLLGGGSSSGGGGRSRPARGGY